MFNMTEMLGSLGGMQQAAQNPGRILTEQMAAQLIRENPERWQGAQGNILGRGRQEQMEYLRRAYAQAGWDLEATARAYGVQL